MVELRQANYLDIDEIIRCRIDLLIEVGDMAIDSNKEELIDRLNSYFNENLGSKFICWVAETDNEIVAISGLNIFEKPPAFSNLSGREGYIMNMYVKKEFRGQGIATRLMHIILEYLKGIGVKQVKAIGYRARETNL